ncbi:unnamed protein product [Heterobilharzia americana]|nr:unnamed protein product [Heterobilharzia americana]
MIDSKALIFKVLIIGSLGVGKQTLLNILLHDTNEIFNKAETNKENIVHTSDVKIILYQRKLDDINYLIQFMKPPNLDSSQIILHSFSEKSDGIILIFDIWTQETLEEIQKFYLFNESQIKTIRKPIYMLLGNKCDLDENDLNQKRSKIPKKQITDFTNNNFTRLSEVITLAYFGFKFIHER